MTTDNALIPITEALNLRGPEREMTRLLEQGTYWLAIEAASDAEHDAEAIRRYAVARLRRAGRSWSEIAAALKVTKQSAHARYSRYCDQ